MASVPAPRRHITRIVIHCTATRDGDALFRDGRTPVEFVDQLDAGRGAYRHLAWRERQNGGLLSFGYHWLIYTSGAVATGRHVDEPGDHAEHRNADSLGICLVGSRRYTLAQWAALTRLVTHLRDTYPGVRIGGHDECPDGPAHCPGFNVRAWVANDFLSDPDHVIQEGEQ